jgi:hypothetical protein
MSEHLQSSASSARRRAVIGLCVLMAPVFLIAGVGAWDVMAPGDASILENLSFPVRLTLTIVAFALVTASFPAMFKYWRKLDELAKHAHYAAWFWGGSIAMAVFMAAVIIAETALPNALATLPGSPLNHIAIGAFGMFLAAAFGYALHWVGFWLTKR